MTLLPFAPSSCPMSISRQPFQSFYATFTLAQSVTHLRIDYQRVENRWGLTHINFCATAEENRGTEFT